MNENQGTRGDSMRRQMSDFVAMLLVSITSLFLLLYIGFGEAHRTYQQLQTEKLMAQGQIVQTTMERYCAPDCH